jgi:hypothetical protein
MRVGVSLPKELVAFADEEAARRGTSRSGLFVLLLEAERVKERVRTYLNRYGWDIAEDEASWRTHQRKRMAEEYGDEKW